ncbi:hypothetical protein M2272_002464 [Mycobacterium frederiksbergense]|uniref:Uncharacterized protein n=1 Tax=Mycolicibacterium frederiksbergense TaxID=117567 RepID=A0ABT6KYQ5_9MYCO|nr:hypothetical protein [Mycolicibacterium frederiksbergense]
MPARLTALRDQSVGSIGQCLGGLTFGAHHRHHENASGGESLDQGTVDREGQHSEIDPLLEADVDMGPTGERHQ